MAFLYSFITITAIFLAGKYLFKKINFLDRPGADLKWVRNPVPTILGIFAYVGFIISIVLFFPEYVHTKLFLWLSLWVLPIIIVELIEELWYMWKIKFRTPQIIRLITHILWALLAVYIWWIGIGQEIALWTFVRQIPQRIFVIFFVIRTMFCINAINRFDWINAQASWVSSIWFITIFILIKFVVMRYYSEFNNLEALTFVSDTALVLAIISLISAIIEFKPLGLLRDIGVMFFWFSLAYLSIVWGAKIGTLVVVLSLVLFDSVRVGLYRIFVMKKNPLKGDYTHLHHRLQRLGRTRWEVRGFVWIRSLIMMILILIQWANRLNKIIIFGIMAIVFFGLNYYLFITKKLPCGLEKIRKD